MSQLISATNSCGGTAELEICRHSQKKNETRGKKGRTVRGKKLKSNARLEMIGGAS